MKSLNYGLRVILIILISCSLLTGIAYIGYQFGIFQPYQEFRAKEHQITPMLDALNTDIEQSLPPLPPNSILKDKSSIGIVPSDYIEHGRWLTITIFTAMNSNDDISAYYHTYLLDHGWLENHSRNSMDTDYYYRKTSCIRILLPGKSNDYYITIWHDFRSQIFSPAVPTFSMKFFELLGSKFAVCP